MRRVLTTATVLIVIATPAFAQSYDPDLGTGNINPPMIANQGGLGSAGAYAQEPGSQGEPYDHSRARTHVRKVHRPTDYGPMRTRNGNDYNND